MMQVSPSTVCTGLTASAAEPRLGEGSGFAPVRYAREDLSRDGYQLLFPGDEPPYSGLTPEHLRAAYKNLETRCLPLLERLTLSSAIQFVQPCALPERAKCLFGLVRTNLGDAVIKIGGTDQSRRALQREVNGADLARQAGLLTPRPFTDYRQSGEMALYAMEYVAPSRGRSFPNSVESRVEIPVELGALVARELLSIFALRSNHLPGASSLPWVEPHISSLETFRAEFARRKGILTDPSCVEIARTAAQDPRMPGASGEQVLSRWLNESERFLQFLDAPSAEAYFCLGDLAPQNLFLLHPTSLSSPAKERRIVLYDLEVVGNAPHWALAALVDWGRFFHRTAPHHALHAAFFETLLEAAPINSRAETASFLHAMILARLVLTSHVAEGPKFNPEWPRLDRLALLMQSIGPAIAFLSEAGFKVD